MLLLPRLLLLLSLLLRCQLLSTLAIAAVQPPPLRQLLLPALAIDAVQLLQLLLQFTLALTLLMCCGGSYC